MKEFWNERYAAEEYIYGEAPNEFFKEKLATLKPGTLLCPAEGEGRNAVYGATQGWKVTAFDISEEGRNKALRLADKKGVKIEYIIASFGTYELTEATFDAIVLTFTHLPAEDRRARFQKIIKALKPGGTLILQGFSKAQFGKTTGGPKDLAMLWSRGELEGDFAGMQHLVIEEKDIILNEGPFHHGTASVIQLTAQR